jgi:hypothetical protein
MSDLFASCKYKLLTVFSIIGVIGVGANYYFPNLENNFFVLLLGFGISALFLSVVLSLEESHQQDESAGRGVTPN